MKPDRFVKVLDDDGQHFVLQCGDCGMLEPDINPFHQFVPQRIQLKRTKGWRMPPHTVKVTRPGIWGNRFIVSPTARLGSRSGAEYICVPTVEDAVARFEEWLKEALKWRPWTAALSELRGKNLACWCPIGSPCHADVLLRYANTSGPS